MQFWIWRYTLKPRRRLSALAAPGAREGALLRAGDGFADIHPWPELGDAPLDEQLKRVETLPAMHCARIDGEARRRGVSLFAGLTIPESHWPGADPPDGFDTVKLKGDSAGFAVPRVLGSSVPHPRGTEEPRNPHVDPAGRSIADRFQRYAHAG